MYFHKINVKIYKSEKHSYSKYFIVKSIKKKKIKCSKIKLIKQNQKDQKDTSTDRRISEWSIDKKKSFEIKTYSIRYKNIKIVHEFNISSLKKKFSIKLKKKINQKSSDN